MYTEDDEEVKTKNEDYDSNDNEVYTSFDELSEFNNKKSKKNNKKKPNKEKKPKIEENNEEDFYDIENENNNTEEYNNSNRKRIIIIGGIILVGIIIIIVVSILLFGNNVKGDIELTKSDMSLKIGDSSYISYKIVDTESSVSSTFKSSDENIVVVDDKGKLIAVGEGTATITISYTIDGKTREKKCTVEVTDDDKVSKEITLNLKLSGGENNKWTNKDVAITVEANSAFGIDKIKYAINCAGTCSYKDINNNSKITVSNNGTTTIKVVANDRKKQTIEKEVIVKIDKEAPKIEFNNQNITSDKDVEVCATCSDSISGCKQEKVCKKFTSSKSNQTITVYDNAGNKKSSGTFNVTIKKANTPTATPKATNAPCSLKVSSDGTVTATLNISAKKYSFDSSFSGGNSLSKKISVTAYKNGVEGDTNGASGAKVVHYYVKDKNGTIDQCYVTVVKECSCSGSTVSNCNVVCKYRSN